MLSFAPFKLLSLALSALSAVTSAQDADVLAKKNGLSSTLAFTANLTLGTGPAPIPIFGGLRIIRPITGGTLTGPLFNAKVSGGFAADGFYNGGAQQRPTVYLYGTTDDNSAFYIQEVGVGNQASWLTRAVSFPGLTAALEVGGKYASLSDAFLVPNNAADKTGSVIQVPIYKVTGAGCC